jgi:hypothetical protein
VAFLWRLANRLSRKVGATRLTRSGCDPHEAAVPWEPTLQGRASLSHVWMGNPRAKAFQAPQPEGGAMGLPGRGGVGAGLTEDRPLDPLLLLPGPVLSEDVYVSPDLLGRLLQGQLRCDLSEVMLQLLRGRSSVVV